MVDRRKVRRRVLMSFIHTFVAVLAMVVVMAAALALCARFGAGRPAVKIMLLGAEVSVVLFLFSEILVVIVLRGERPDPAKYPNFVQGMEAVCRKKWMLKPRLYILHLKVPGTDEEVPNAMAFGLGFFGQYAVGITPKLYESIDREELEGVLEHEVGHIRCMDVGLMTFLAIVTGGAEKLAALFKKGQTVLGKGPFAYIMSTLLIVFAKFVFPVGRAAISQEREYCADALAASAMNTPDPLIRALKISAAMPPRPDDEKGAFDDLFLSHPNMQKRFDALESLRA